MKKNKIRYIANLGTIILIIIILTLVLFEKRSFAINQNISQSCIKVATTTSKNSVKDPDASNTLLKSLKVEGYEIFPEFNKYTTTYYVKIPTEIREIEVNAEAESENATVNIRGNSYFYNTENTITISVTSKDRSNRRYKIIATRQDDNELKLKELSIEGAKLSPEFSENIYNYTASTEIIKINSISPLEIKATANSETAKIEILGNSDLEEGENLISIVLKDKDESGEDITSIYQVNVNISSKTMITTIEGSNFELKDKIKEKAIEIYGIVKEKIIEWFEDENRKIATITAGGVVLVVLLFIIISSKLKKRNVEKKKEKIKRRAK